MATPLTVQGITTGLLSVQPSIRIATSRGSLEQPSVVKNKDSLGVLKFNAFTGGKSDPYVNAAFIAAYVNDRSDLLGKQTVDASLILGSASGITTETYVEITPSGTLIAPAIESLSNQNNLIIKDGTLTVNFNDYPQPDWKGKEHFLSGTAGGCNYEYKSPININTKSTGIKIEHTGNFKQPSFRVDSYDDNGTQASWMSFNRFRGTPDNPMPLEDGDFIFAFDWLGKSSKSQPWEWGMAQTAIVEGTPTEGFLPISINWVTRDLPYGEPTVKVKIDNFGKLHAFRGVNLGLEEIDQSKVDTTITKYFKLQINGNDYAIAVHAIKND